MIQTKIQPNYTEARQQKKWKAVVQKHWALRFWPKPLYKRRKLWNSKPHDSLCSLSHVDSVCSPVWWMHSLQGWCLSVLLSSAVPSLLLSVAVSGVWPASAEAWAMELKVWVEGVLRVVCGLSLSTSCQDVVITLAQAIGMFSPDCLHSAVLFTQFTSRTPNTFVCYVQRLVFFWKPCSALTWSPFRTKTFYWVLLFWVFFGKHFEIQADLLFDPLERL